jgi:hypothetical protein
MNDPATNLDRLHDIVLPPAAPWWPPAPGWYVVLGIALVLAALLTHRIWRRWRANAYRRIALRELAAVDDAAGVAELLRRTAMATTPRSVIAEKTGAAWLDWLAAQGREAMPRSVRDQLTAGVYGRREAPDELPVLRDYAARWITRHRPPSRDAARPTGPELER